MKIHTLTIIIFFLMFSISFAQRNKTDLQKMNLKGKIVWIEEMEYNSTGKKRIISREETSQVTIQKFEKLFSNIFMKNLVPLLFQEKYLFISFYLF